MKNLPPILRSVKNIEWITIRIFAPVSKTEHSERVSIQPFFDFSIEALHLWNAGLSSSTLLGGVGSDLTYVLTASFAWQFGDRSSLTLGYRYLYFDYEKGYGANRFKFDMKQHGPAVGYRFRW